MEWIIIGLIVGLVLGLTGSGGGLVAIPLFIQLSGQDLKQATVFSLIVVIMGALLNWIPQRKNTIYKISIGVFLFSIPTAFLGKYIKSSIDENVIAILLMVMALFSLWNIWKAKSKTDLGTKEIKISYIKIAFTGATLGLLTVLTGLGGGVLLVPLYLLLKLNLTQAVATSLLTICFSSAVSILIQWEQVQGNINLIELLYLLGGTIISTFIIKSIINKVSADKLTYLRKILFTIIVTWVGYSMIN